MPSNSASAHSKDVKRRIVERLRDKPFERAFEDETFRELLEEDALGEAPIFTADAIAGLNEARELRHQKRAATAPSLFFSNKSVLIVPGFLGSQLRDDGPAGNDLIWIDPKLYITSRRQRRLRAPAAGPLRQRPGWADALPRHRLQRQVQGSLLRLRLHQQRRQFQDLGREREAEGRQLRGEQARAVRDRDGADGLRVRYAKTAACRSFTPG